MKTPTTLRIKIFLWNIANKQQLPRKKNMRKWKKEEEKSSILQSLWWDPVAHYIRIYMLINHVALVWMKPKFRRIGSKMVCSLHAKHQYEFSIYKPNCQKSVGLLLCWLCQNHHHHHHNQTAGFIPENHVKSTSKLYSLYKFS